LVNDAEVDPSQATTDSAFDAWNPDQKPDRFEANRYGSKLALEATASDNVEAVAVGTAEHLGLGINGENNATVDKTLADIIEIIKVEGMIQETG
jgi:hypothetical protein